MKKRFYRVIIGGILSAAFCAGTLVQASPVAGEQNQKKEPVQVIVVDKKGRDSRSLTANDKSRVPQAKSLSSNGRKGANQ